MPLLKIEHSLLLGCWLLLLLWFWLLGGRGPAADGRAPASQDASQVVLLLHCRRGAARGRPRGQRARRLTHLKYIHKRSCPDSPFVGVLYLGTLFPSTKLLSKYLYPYCLLINLAIS